LRGFVPSIGLWIKVRQHRRLGNGQPILHICTLLRNLVDNALRHGAAVAPLEAALLAFVTFMVVNDGPVPPVGLARLANRFERAVFRGYGSGLGLAITAALAGRVGSHLVPHPPPRP
jgi:two-component system OmpR family sensor kinase